MRSDVRQRKYAERSRRIVNRLVSEPAPVLPDPSLVTGGVLTAVRGPCGSRCRRGGGLSRPDSANSG